MCINRRVHPPDGGGARFRDPLSPAGPSVLSPAPIAGEREPLPEIPGGDHLHHLTDAPSTAGPVTTCGSLKPGLSPHRVVSSLRLSQGGGGRCFSVSLQPVCLPCPPVWGTPRGNLWPITGWTGGDPVLPTVILRDWPFFTVAGDLTCGGFPPRAVVSGIHPFRRFVSSAFGHPVLTPPCPRRPQPV